MAHLRRGDDLKEFAAAPREILVKPLAVYQLYGVRRRTFQLAHFR
jgi:hypothetical protein